ncbi:hypothetical protein MKP08_10480 [Erythrobacter sp. LQ02-29]|uniref:hypothetical protein n=1 Tax=Erythrobacter sp. LQ02-29 TaxID=2920384 RepID=UPI001F4F0211|nr:hypothetical protein [Erythrobacter sp. LQ02-29]MCP9223175.1 hypothetical protein [Erythrobacter sp. LQ02-29]
MRWIFPLLAIAGLAACSEEPSEEDNAAKVAAVEANQIPAVIPATPQPLEEAVVQSHPEGCSFINAKTGAVIAFAGSQYGFMKLDGSMDRFAPDVGSPQTDVGLPSNYDGANASFTLHMQSREERAGMPVGLLTVTDGYDRVIYQKEGTVDCRGVGPGAN